MTRPYERFPLGMRVERRARRTGTDRATRGTVVGRVRPDAIVVRWDAEPDAEPECVNATEITALGMREVPSERPGCVSAATLLVLGLLVVLAVYGDALAAAVLP